MTGHPGDALPSNLMRVIVHSDYAPMKRQALFSEEFIYKLILLNCRIQHTLIVMSRCSLALNIWHGSKYNLLLYFRYLEMFAQDIQSTWEARHPEIHYISILAKQTHLPCKLECLYQVLLEAFLYVWLKDY